MKRSWLGSVRRAGPAWACVVLALASCSDDPVGPAVPGEISVTTVTTGDELDPDGYAVILDGGAQRTIAANAAVTISDVAAGSHELMLEQVASNCSLSGANPRTVQVASGQMVATTFVLSCVATTGELTVQAATSGSAQDDAYSFRVDGGEAVGIGPSESVTVSDVPEGLHAVELFDVAGNCAVNGANPLSVTVPAGGPVTALFEVTCTAETGDLRVVTSTSGSGLDDGYEVVVDGGAPLAIGIADTVLVSGLAPGNHVVQLQGVAPNCTISGENPRSVAIEAGEVTESPFAVSCEAAVGSVRVTTSTWGLGADSGYDVSVAGAAPEPIGADATVTVGDVPEGEIGVQLTGIAGNCSVQGPNPVTTSLTEGQTVDVAFAVFCFQSLSNQVAFESDRSGSRDIWVMSSTGGGPVRLTTFGGSEREPDVAPDGSAIVFDADEGQDGAFDIWILDEDGIRKLSDQSGTERSPTFSGDGAAVAYTWSSSSSTWEIWRVNRDGSGRNRVMSEVDAARGDDEQPAWSADGSWILFRSDRDEPLNYDIYVMDASGANIRRLTTDPGEDGKPAWSSDGTRITWSSNRAGSFDVWRANIDPVNGVLSDLKNLTEGSAGTDGKSDWRPGTSEIAFASDTEGDNEIFRISDALPGQPVPTPVRLTDNADMDIEPSWSP